MQLQIIQPPQSPTQMVSVKSNTPPEGKKMDDSTTEIEENNNFFDPKGKEIANKTQ